jgi:hypothetical protein
MKILINELERLDKYFATKKESEKWMMILAVAGMIAYIGYTFLLPYAQDLYKSSESKKNRLTKQIAEENAYLNSITIGGDRNFYIKQYNKDIQEKKKQLVFLNKRIDYINSSLEQLSDMLFNKKSWANFLNSITENAKLCDVDVEFIKNRYVDNKGNFGHVLEVEIGSSGNFKDIVKFLNLLEQNTLVTDIYSSSFKGGNDNISADINISVWGINH